MGFLKSLFGKKEEPEGESFVPTPIQNVPGLEPLVVQVVETLFPNSEDQQIVFKDLLAAKKDSAKNFVNIHLNILFYSEGKINRFSKIVADIKNYDSYRDIWPLKEMKEWAVNVIKEGKYVAEPIYKIVS